MFKKTTIIFATIVLMFIVFGCGSSSGPDKSGAAYTGDWVNVNELGLDNFIERVTIKKSGDHFVFEFTFEDGSGMSAPATYKDSYFTIQMPGYTWAGFFDKETGYLIVSNQQFRKKS